jgi:phosphate transport system permease protein
MKEKIRLKLSGKILTFPLASVSILAVFFIFIFVFSQGLPLFSKISPFDFFFNPIWRPTATPPSFGIVALFLGSLLVTSLALLISVPLGLLGAIYIAEITNPKIKEPIKLTVEVLSGIPSVVYGFFRVEGIGAASAEDLRPSDGRNRAHGWNSSFNNDIAHDTQPLRGGNQLCAR